MITAKAKGLGPMGGDILSNEKPVFLIVNPGLEDVSKPPPPLHLKFEGSLEEIGPYSIAMQSAYCMVGGLLLFRLNLLFPPTDLIIYSIKVKIVQAFQLRSPVDKDHAVTPPPYAQSVFILDATNPPNMAKISEDNARGAKSGMQTPKTGPLKTLRKDEMYRLHHLARLPNDNHIRPSTQEGTTTPIACHHTIQCEITYRPMTEDESNPPPFDPHAPGGRKAGKDKEKNEPERRKVVMSKPVDIFSVRPRPLSADSASLRARRADAGCLPSQCCCFLDSLTLPVYSLLDPNPVPLDAELQLPCVCSYTMKQCVARTPLGPLLPSSSLQALTVSPLSCSPADSSSYTLRRSSSRARTRRSSTSRSQSPRASSLRPRPASPTSRAPSSRRASPSRRPRRTSEDGLHLGALERRPPARAAATRPPWRRRRRPPRARRRRAASSASGRAATGSLP